MQSPVTHHNIPQKPESTAMPPHKHQISVSVVPTGARNYKKDNDWQKCGWFNGIQYGAKCVL